METIYKYPIEATDLIQLEMPKDAQILSVQSQAGVACIWALVNPDEPTEYRYFEIFGTGHPMQSDMGLGRRYIGTYQLLEGSLVFHLFERS